MDDRLIEKIESWNLRYFKPYEFLTQGVAHDNPDSAAYGLNSYPPESKWDNMRKTAEVIDEFRKRIGAPIVITNAYRSPKYNKAIGGALHSQHIEFKALDFVVRGNSTPADWAKVLRSMRTEG